MHAALSDAAFVLKRYGRISGGRYRLYGLRHDHPLLFIEEKTDEISPLDTAHVYEDEESQREILTLTDSEATGTEIDVMDVEIGHKVGTIAMAVDDAGDFVADTWLISDGEGKLLGKALKKRIYRPVARATPGAAPPQALDITIGGALVGELRQKVNVVGYELSLDFSMDVAHLLDRRLGLAMAIFAALDQEKAD